MTPGTPPATSSNTTPTRIRRNSWLRPLLTGFSLLVLAVGLLLTVNSRPAPTLPDPQVNIQAASQAASGEQTAVFAGGCFWGMEGVFEHVRGVSEVMTGYAGGTAETATYKQVSSGATNHAESVQVVYDPAQISYGDLLKVYFSVAHDPTQLNRQGPDYGVQYRSEIFFANEQQQQMAEAYIDQLNQARLFSDPVVTKLEPLDQFYAAETYHQNFIQRNPLHPYVVVHDLPQIRQLQAQFPDLYQ